MSEENVSKSKHIRTVSLSSSKPESKVHSISMPNVVLWLLLLVSCVLLGVLIGFVFFESKQVLAITQEVRQQKELVSTLEQEKADLEAQYQAKYEAEIDQLKLDKAGLEEQVQVLSDTINLRLAEDEAAALTAAEKSIPTGFPVTGSATTAEAPEEDNALEMAVYYEALQDAVVVATANGRVSGVRQNAYEYYEIQVDHGNGYVSVYTNEGAPLLAEGAEVLKGTPLFYIGEDNTLIKYQISKDGALIDVYEVMNIAG